MKVFFVVTVARQVEGDIVAVHFDKCFSDQTKAEEFYKTLRQEPIKNVIMNGQPVQFACERRIHEIDLE